MSRKSRAQSLPRGHSSHEESSFRVSLPGSARTSRQARLVTTICCFDRAIAVLWKWLSWLSGVPVLTDMIHKAENYSTLYFYDYDFIGAHCSLNLFTVLNSDSHVDTLRSVWILIIAMKECWKTHRLHWQWSGSTQCSRMQLIKSGTRTSAFNSINQDWIF